MENIKYLVFSGGGIRGVAYSNIPRILQEYNILPNIKGIAGTSAGSIIAGLLALRVSPENVYNIVTTMDYNKFKDDSYGILLDLYRLGTKYGWNKGDYFLNWYDNILQTYTGIHNITLQQAYEITNIEFTAVSTCWNTSLPTYFNYKTHPTLPLSMAVRMSMSYPFFFVPSEYEGRLYVDGGMTNNFPIELYPADSVLGFKLISNNEKVNDGKITTALVPTGLLSYATNLISIMLRTVENANTNPEYWDRTIFIDTGDISSMNFDITPDQELWLIQNGEKSLKTYLDKL